jgi:hypothetical protein
MDAELMRTNLIRPELNEFTLKMKPTEAQICNLRESTERLMINSFVLPDIRSLTDKFEGEVVQKVDDKFDYSIAVFYNPLKEVLWN